MHFFKYAIWVNPWICVNSLWLTEKNYFQIQKFESLLRDGKNTVRNQTCLIIVFLSSSQLAQSTWPN